MFVPGSEQADDLDEGFIGTSAFLTGTGPDAVSACFIFDALRLGFGLVFVLLFSATGAAELMAFDAIVTASEPEMRQLPTLSSQTLVSALLGVHQGMLLRTKRGGHAKIARFKFLAV